MELELRINGVIKSLDVTPNESLLTVLRQEGYFSVKHGCETGECGACTVLVDGVPRPSYVKPVQAVLRAAAVLRGETVSPISRTTSDQGFDIIGKPERKVDAVKLVTGKPVFVDDIELRDMLYACLLTSPHAHAVIRHID